MRMSAIPIPDTPRARRPLHGRRLRRIVTSSLRVVVRVTVAMILILVALPAAVGAIRA